MRAVLSAKELSGQTDYYSCVSDLLNDENVLRLREFTHHLATTRFQHSVNVSYYNYRVCLRLGLDARSAARAGLLHDLFFYDRRHHIRVEGEKNHASEHPKIAFFTAAELYPLNQREGDMIANHMWPLSRGLPAFGETWVITFVDKFCAVAEVCAYGVRKARGAAGKLHRQFTDYR